MRDSVERIGDHNDAGSERYPLPLETPGISFAVPPFVMTEHSFGEISIETRQGLEDTSPDPRMSLDLPTLGGSEVAGLIDDIVERSIDLANVVKERNAFHAVLRALVQVSGFGNDQRIFGDAPDVRACRRIVRVDCVEKCLQGRGSKPLETNSCPPLAGDQSSRRRNGNKKRSVSKHGSA